MSNTALYPLRFEPIYQYRLWGGRRLARLFATPLPEGPIGEAWLLSDRQDHPSLVAEGPLKGHTLTQLFAQLSAPLMGKLDGRFARFPLLLKFLDAREMLSVQVHPSDLQTSYLPVGETGKTEAWVVLATGPKSRIYAGLKPGTTAADLRRALANETIAGQLAHITPKIGDAILLESGTVHSLGDLVVFEVQQNSDVTFRLYDWDRIDAKTGHPRALQVDQAIACVDFTRAPVAAVVPLVEQRTTVLRERLIDCEHFCMWRLHGELPFEVGAPELPRVLVCIAGEGSVTHGGSDYNFGTGDVLLLPSVVGACLCRPHGTLTLLEISLPEGTR